jgi:hypothetical protein
MPKKKELVLKKMILEVKKNSLGYAFDDDRYLKLTSCLNLPLVASASTSSCPPSGFTTSRPS